MLRNIILLYWRKIKLSECFNKHILYWKVISIKKILCWEILEMSLLKLKEKRSFPSAKLCVRSSNLVLSNPFPWIKTRKSIKIRVKKINRQPEETPIWQRKIGDNYRTEIRINTITPFVSWKYINQKKKWYSKLEKKISIKWRYHCLIYPSQRNLK